MMSSKKNSKKYKVICSNNPECNLPNIPLSAIQKWIEKPYEYVEVEMGYKDHWSKLLVEEQHEPIELHTQIKVVDGYVVPVFDITTILAGYSEEEYLQETAKEAGKQYSIKAEERYLGTPYEQRRYAFEAGAKWKEEQVSNDVIKFTEWISIECSQKYRKGLSWIWIQNGTEKEYTTEELYNIYKQSKQ